MAEQLVRKLGYDCGRFRLSASPIINIAHRARKLDEIARSSPPASGCSPRAPTPTASGPT
jgi:hypothetical protein